MLWLFYGLVGPMVRSHVYWATMVILLMEEIRLATWDVRNSNGNGIFLVLTWCRIDSSINSSSHLSICGERDN